MTLGEVSVHRLHAALLDRASATLNKASKTDNPQNYTVLMATAGVILDLATALLASIKEPDDATS